MEDFINNFHFLRPWWLLALLLPLAGYFRFFAGLKNVSAWEGVCDQKLLDFLLVRGSSRQRSLVANLLFAGMAGAIVALAGPAWQKKDIPAFAPENPVMFLLNMSSDMDNTDVTPNRLTRSKYAISDLLKQLGSAQSGLIVYTEEPFLISPLTEDSGVIDNLLGAVVPDIMPENGDRLNRAIDYAVARLRESGYQKGNIVVLAADVGQDFNLAMISAAAAEAKGYRVSTIIANQAGSDKLKMIAEKGGGIAVNVASGITRLATYLSQDTAQKLKQSRNNREIWEDAGYYLLIIPLLCALYFFRRGIMTAVIALGFVHNAQAGFFLNNNQEAMRAFNNQDFEKAAAGFEDPGWKASAYYRSGDFERAYEYFAGDDAESLYNQGNALAKSGKTEEAIAKYEQVLELEPAHEDAKFNLEYLKRQQQQQQSSGQQQNQEQNRQQPNQQQQQSSGEQSSDETQPQNQNRQSDQNPDRQSSAGGQGTEAQQQQTPQPRPAEQNRSGGDDKENSQQSEAAQPQERQESSAQQPQAEAEGNQPPEKGEPEYTEAVQAREQQFRDIPEDSGGLLRAFIRKEYLKNRYKDN